MGCLQLRSYSRRPVVRMRNCMSVLIVQWTQELLSKCPFSGMKHGTEVIWLRIMNSPRLSCSAWLVQQRKTWVPELCFASMQEKDNVPEDRGPVQDLRELERLDQVHDAGDHTQRDCHVSTHTHTRWHSSAEIHPTCISQSCVMSQGPWWWQPVTCLPSPNRGRCRARYSVISTQWLLFGISCYCKTALRPQWHPAVHSNKERAGTRAPREAQREGNRW